MMALDFAPTLRSVGLAPGITLPSGKQTEAEFLQAHQMTPMGYSSSADDIAQAALFIANAKAITGTTIYVDGGQHLIPSKRDVMFNTQ
jgi:NAD(P)-dependent dehydrogenase (short-subunit alcohol dehydrogenase family)